MSASMLGSSALPEFEDELEGEEFDLGGLVKGLLGEGEGEFELEDEFEYEDEWEGEFEDESERMANPLRRVYPDAMMEHLGHAAAEAETEAEAEAFVGALVPLAARMVRAAAPHVARSTPHLVRGLSTVARTLRRNPTTRQLVRVLPTVASRTTHSLARHAAHGHPITPRRAVHTLARQTAAALSDPRARHHIVRRARAADRRYHQVARPGQRRPGAPVISGRGLAQRPAAPRPRVPYRYGTPVRYGYGTPVSYGAPARQAGTAGYRSGAGYQVTSGRGAPAVAAGRPVRGRGQPRRRTYPAGMSIAWVPVPAWTGRRPPAGAYRY
jgi:hypothetical protein